MREIKFRAWNPNEQIMYYNRQLGETNGITYESVVIEAGGYAMVVSHKCNGDISIGRLEDVSIIMQFTGLTDKNQTEIYEGDILLMDKDTVPVSVVYGNRFASFGLVRKGWVFMHYFGEACEGRDTTVIGNIYQNP